MRYSTKALQKLRAGQMVWRVLFHVDDRRGQIPKIVSSITPTWVLGKKILHWFRHHETGKIQWSSMKVEARKAKYDFAYDMDVSDPMRTAHFLADLQGHGAFNSLRHAERYVREVEEGLHPDVIERLFFDHEMDKDMDSMMREYDEAYDFGYEEENV